MNTLEDKLLELMNTKSKIRTKIISMGVDLSASEPFRNYPDFIGMIREMEDTTTDQDLLQICDVVMELGDATYENKFYTDEEIQKVKDLVNLIVEGGITR